MNACLIRLLLSLAIAALLPAAALGQQPPPPSVPADGPEFFGHVLHSAGFRSVRSFAELDNIDHADLLIVVFGDMRPIPEIERHLGRNLEQFVDEGGAVLIASDRRSERRFFQTRFPGPDESIYDKLPRRYQNLRRCPLITRAHCTDPAHPLFSRLFLSGQSVAANNPSLLKPSVIAPRPVTQALTQFPGLDGTLVVAPQADDARRFLLIGGHGMFINDMMAPMDLENYEFAGNVADWLRDGSRRRVLFVHEGSVVERIGLLPPINLTNIINRGLNTLQRRLDELQRENFETILRVLTVVVTGLVLLYGLKRFIGNRYHVEQPMLAIGVPVRSSPESVAHGRIEQMMARNQYWEAAQVLVRQFFRMEAGLDLPFPLTGLAAPRAEYHAGTWQRWRLNAALARVWSLARGVPTQRMSANRIVKLQADLDTLRRALRAGELSIAPTL